MLSPSVCGAGAEGTVFPSTILYRAPMLYVGAFPSPPVPQ